MEFTTKKQLFEILKNDFFNEMQKNMKDEEFTILYLGINNFLEEAGVDFCIPFIETMKKGSTFNWEMITITNQHINAVLFFQFLKKINDYFEDVEND